MISGAFRTTPTLALNTMLSVVPVDIAGKDAAVHSAIRIKSSGFLFRLVCSEAGSDQILF